jgi:hypothetical protein
VFPQKYLNDIERDLKRTCWFYGRDENGKVFRYAGSRRGNRAYAKQTQWRINASAYELCKMDGTLFSITLTAPYIYNEKSILKSWEIIKKQWPVFLQWVRRNGFNAYIMSYEAFKKGGCHIHLITKYKDKLDVDTGRMVVRYSQNKKNIPLHFMDNEKTIQNIKRRIKKSWKIGTVKIKIIDDENAEKTVRYVSKEIGWGSQIEDALRNVKKGEATADDIQKLWAHYISMRLNYHRWSTSRNLKPPLDSKMSNSIKNKDHIIDYVIIPSSAVKSGKIKLEWGMVKFGSDEDKLATDLFEKKSQKNTDTNSMVMEALNIDTPISFSR